MLNYKPRILLKKKKIGESSSLIKELLVRITTSCNSTACLLHYQHYVIDLSSKAFWYKTKYCSVVHPLQPCYNLFKWADANQVWPLFNKKTNILLGSTHAQKMFALKPLYLPHTTIAAESILQQQCTFLTDAANSMTSCPVFSVMFCCWVFGV